MRDVQRTESDARLDGIIRDAQAELTALRRELVRYRGIFDSARLIVGHEFAKPLTAANGYLELLEDHLGEAIGAREAAYIAKIRSAFARLEELVESFVQMLRIEHGSDDLRAIERIEVGALVAKVRERIEDGAVLEVNIPDDMPPVLARRRCIEVVLENLVSNAVKHGGGRPVSISAAVTQDRRDDRGKGLLVLSVEDHGPGIPEDKLEDIFTPFFRLESGKNRDGLGLGLALVKSIVTIMKGDIHVRSKPGEGTTITIAVPVVNEASMVPDTVG